MLEISKAVFLLFAVSLSHCQQPAYIFTAPSKLQKGSNETFCITFHNVKETVHLKVALKLSKQRYEQASHSFPEGNGKCFPFYVPESIVDSLWNTKLRLIGKTRSGSINFDVESPIVIRLTSGLLVFVQTDKPIYKPGQTVRIRLLVLDTDRKPVALPIKKGESILTLENPQSIRYMQWKNLTSSNGLMTFEFPLSKDALLGKWTIAASIGNKRLTSHKFHFTVKKYVLPKYEVSVKAPEYVTPFVSSVPIKICAKYTYGQSVEGTLVCNVCLKERRYWHGTFDRACTTVYRKIYGCTQLDIDSKTLKLPFSNYSLSYSHIAIKVSVTETATGISRKKTTEIEHIRATDLKLTFVDTDDVYKPGIPFSVTVKATRLDGNSVSNIQIKLTSDVTERTLTSDENGIVRTKLPPIMTDDKVIKIEARAEDSTVEKLNKSEIYHSQGNAYASHGAKPWFSPSYSYIDITNTPGVIACNTKLNLEASYVAPPDPDRQFYYQVTNYGKIIDQGVIKTLAMESRPIQWPVNPPVIEDTGSRVGEINRMILRETEERRAEALTSTLVGKFKFALNIGSDFTPQFNLLVYFLIDKEVVADTIRATVDECLDNKVSMDFSTNQASPSQQVNLTLTASPNSVCSVGVVDKSVHLLGGDNQMTAKKVFQALSELSPYKPKYDTQWSNEMTQYCQKRHPNAKFQQHNYGANTHYKDSSFAFDAANVLTVSNLDLETRPCFAEDMIYYAIPISAELAPGALPVEPRGESVTDSTTQGKVEQSVRTNFPESWLWELADIGESGTATVIKTAPDTISQFVGNAVCTNAKTGFGISDKASLTVFKKLFVSFAVPYSAIRGEQVPVTISVFNYLDICLNVRLDIEESDKYHLIGQRNKTACVCGQRSFSHDVYIVAKDIGDIAIIAKAYSLNETVNTTCVDDAEADYQEASDAMQQKLLVEAEGLPKETAVSYYICPKDKEEMKFEKSLMLPSPVIKDSARAYVTVIGDLMGPTLDGLESLIRLPSGCGEQTASSLAPNIYVMHYLEATRQLTEKMTEQLIKNMKHGHQRMLGFQVKPQTGQLAYAVWTDGSPSVWLTLFTMKSFANAAPYIYVDDEDQKLAINFIESQLSSEGCILPLGYQHTSSWFGEQPPERDLSLTAYALIAMLEAKYDKDTTVIQKTTSCLKKYYQYVKTGNMYTMARIAYAFSLYDPLSKEASSMISKLKKLSITQGGLTFWQHPGSTERYVTSLDIETTAYALLALLSRGDALNDPRVPRIVQWFTKQRNALGGFRTTQDTVMALQALAKYASGLSFGNTFLDIVMAFNSSPRDMIKFNVNNDNKLVLQKQPIKAQLPVNVSLAVVGEGCALVQMNLLYNVPAIKPVLPAFSLVVSSRSAPKDGEQCKTLYIKACTAYVGTGRKSGMALMEVSMVTGWIANEQSLQSLVRNVALNIAKYEIKENNDVVIYFKSIRKYPHCIEFMAMRTLKVLNSQPAKIKVYDYYNLATMVTKTYSEQLCVLLPIPPGSDPFPPFSGWSNPGSLQEIGPPGRVARPGHPVLTITSTPPTTTPPSNCTAKGKVYRHGEQYKINKCVICMCYDGVPSCTGIDCAEYLNPGFCKNWIPVKDQCCSVCGDDEMKETATPEPPPKRINLENVDGKPITNDKKVGEGEGGDLQPPIPTDMAGPMRVPTTPLPQASCPVCVEKVDLSDLKRLFCKANFAYKTMLITGEYPLKVQANIRPVAKQVISRFSHYSMDDSCQCSVLTGATKVIILSQKYLYDDNLIMDSGTVIFRYINKIDKTLKQYAATSYCKNFPKFTNSA